MNPPRCIVIAGPNGAGKTTFAREYLPTEAGIIHFVNTDLIAAGTRSARCRENIVTRAWSAFQGEARLRLRNDHERAATTFRDGMSNGDSIQDDPTFVTCIGRLQIPGKCMTIRFDRRDWWQSAHEKRSPENQT